MIRMLSVEGFTVFSRRETFSFVPGINIIVGGNDSGKSHLMKLCYAFCKWSNGGSRRSLPETWAEEKRLRKDLLRVFGVQSLTNLTSRHDGCQATSLSVSMEGDKAPLGTADVGCRFLAGREEDGLSLHPVPQRYLRENAIFLSPREVLSIYPFYTQVGRRYPDLLDSASWDLCQALEEAPAPGKLPLPGALQHVLRQIEALLSGHLCRLNGRFWLQRPGMVPLELNLVAEGFKRLGTLGLLLDNGMVHSGTSLFWDEPEMNLNATHLPILVSIMMGMCRAGIQLMLTTHSLFLLRELTIQLSSPLNRHVTRRFFGLQPPEERQEGVCLSSGETLDDISPIESLSAEMEQADRYLNLPPAGRAKDD